MRNIRVKAIEKYVAVIAFPMFIAMILACTSSQEAVSGVSASPNYETNDADADGAMITDTITSPFNDYALNK